MSRPARPRLRPRRHELDQDDIVVEVHTDEGITGIGETDLNAWVARACIEAPGTHTMDLGLGSDACRARPARPVAVWDEALRRYRDDRAARCRRARARRARHGTVGHLRQGGGRADLAAPRPRRHTSPSHPYASLLPNRGSSWDDFSQALVDQARWAHGLGFHGAKLEALVAGPYAHEGLKVRTPAWSR